MLGSAGLFLTEGISGANTSEYIMGKLKDEQVYQQ